MISLSKVQFIQVVLSYTWFVELVFNSLLIFNDVPLNSTQRCSIVSLDTIVSNLAHTWHVSGVLDDGESLRIGSDLWLWSWWKLMALSLECYRRKLFSSWIDPSRMVFLTKVFHSILLLKCFFTYLFLMNSNTSVPETNMFLLVLAQLLIRPKHVLFRWWLLRHINTVIVLNRILLQFLILEFLVSSSNLVPAWWLWRHLIHLLHWITDLGWCIHTHLGWRSNLFRLWIAILLHISLFSTDWSYSTIVLFLFIVVLHHLI